MFLNDQVTLFFEFGRRHAKAIIHRTARPPGANYSSVSRMFAEYIRHERCSGVAPSTIDRVTIVGVSRPAKKAPGVPPNLLVPPGKAKGSP